FFAEVADVLVVQIDIHETSQLPFFREKVLAQLSIFYRQFPQRFADGLCGKLRGITLSREGPQRGRDDNFDSHFSLHSSFFKTLRRLSSSALAKMNGFGRKFRMIVL